MFNGRNKSKNFVEKKTGQQLFGIRLKLSKQRMKELRNEMHSMLTFLGQIGHPRRSSNVS